MARAAMLHSIAAGPQIEAIADPGMPASGEVLVAMRLAPINPADRLMIAGNYAVQPILPALLGAEGVGEVVAVGVGVAGFAPGDRVIPLSRGNWTNWRMLAARDLVQVPAALSIEQAAMLRINPATAWRLLARAELRPGDWLVQNGGGSAVARIVSALARRRGIGVVNVVRDPRRWRGDGVVLADGPDLSRRVAAAAGGAPVTVALDCVAGEASGRLAACLAQEGRLIVYGHLSGEPCSIPSMLLTGAGITLSGFSLRPAETGDDQAALAALYQELAVLMAAPEAQSPVAAVYPLERLAEALADRSAGRILLALDG